jgi:hypothetical protein
MDADEFWFSPQYRLWRARTSRTSWSTSALVAVLLLLLVLPLPLAVPPLRPLPRRRRLRVRAGRFTTPSLEFCMLIISTEKEESDEDMGFGLFD